jgi:minor curlin subunit
VSQRAVNAGAKVWQKVGSRSNSVNVQQGTNDVLGPSAEGQQSNAVNLVANITQSGRGSSAWVGQLGTNQTADVTQTGNLDTVSSANVVSLTQANANNVARIIQDGNNLVAAAGQLGAGTALRRNLVTIQQTGDRHRATARQEGGVSASGESAPSSGEPGFLFYRGPGAQTAEIQIIQQGARSADDVTSTGNSATITQQGQGQYARIFQNGRTNTAGILQGVNATNAVAVIEQAGTGNSFFITQNAPGQYMRIVQNGNGNIIMTEASGPANTGGGSTPGGTGSGSAQPPIGEP